MKDLRIEIKIKNNLIFQKIKEIYGDISIAEFCQRINIQDTEMSFILNFKKSPIIKRRNGPTSCGVDGLTGFYWRKIAIDISIALNCLPEDLFPEHLREVRKNFYALEIDSAILIAATERSEIKNPEQIMLANETKDHTREGIVRVLSALTRREELVLCKRFGFDGEEELSLDAIGEMISCSRERVRQIELKALRELRHPARAEYLRKYM